MWFDITFIFQARYGHFCLPIEFVNIWMDQCFQITPGFLCIWQGSGKGNSFEELQKLFVSMFSADLAAFDNSIAPPNCTTSDKKRGASNPFHFFESPEESFAQAQNHFFGCGNDVNTSTPKKTKSNLHSNSNTSTNNLMQFDRTCSNPWWRAAYLLF